ncbi:conserved fungal protein [Lentinula edodes]|uniref:Conserved fungal protein n=1 Tax=Lentinula edodes TaxID=5353 RepID=A0A1Q3EHF1_LENED|nr:conserved fungal protein [Lentinula edodes]
MASPPPFRTARILLHSAAAAIMISGYHNLTKLPINAFISTQYGGHLQYLTIQGLFITCATTLISLLMDLFPSVNALKPLKRILLIIAMPLSITISSIYWPLLLLATQLILQNGSGEPSSSPHAPQPLLRIPLPMDLSLHAVPALTLLADFLLFEKKYTRKEIRGVRGSMGEDFPTHSLRTTHSKYGWQYMWARGCWRFRHFGSLIGCMHSDIESY